MPSVKPYQEVGCLCLHWGKGTGLNAIKCRFYQLCKIGITDQDMHAWVLRRKHWMADPAMLKVLEGPSSLHVSPFSSRGNHVKGHLTTSWLNAGHLK